MFSCLLFNPLMDVGQCFQRLYFLKSLLECSLKSLFFLVILGPHSWHIKVPRLGVESEPQLLVYTTATAMLHPSCVFDLHHSSGQRLILNPLSGARDRTYVPMDARWVRLLLSHNGNASIFLYCCYVCLLTHLFTVSYSGLHSALYGTMFH